MIDKLKLNKLIKILEYNKLTIASSESITGGKFSQIFTQKSGSSSYFLGSIVSYSNNSKIKLLDIDKNLIKEKGAVSSETAFLMSKNIQEKLSSDISISFTGNAGPNASEGKQIGLVYISIFFKKDNKIFNKNFEFKSNFKKREDIKDDVINFGIKEIINIWE